MGTQRIVAANIETAYGENPEYTALVASRGNDTVEVVIETTKVPIACASLLKSSQDAMHQFPPTKIEQELAWNLEGSMQILPEAIDLSLAADGNVLCINVGSGALCLKLTDAAKQSLKNM